MAHGFTSPHSAYGTTSTQTVHGLTIPHLTHGPTSILTARESNSPYTAHGPTSPYSAYGTTSTLTVYAPTRLMTDNKPISSVSMPRLKIRAHYKHMSEFERGRTIGFKEAGKYIPRLMDCLNPPNYEVPPNFSNTTIAAPKQPCADKTLSTKPWNTGLGNWREQPLPGFHYPGSKGYYPGTIKLGSKTFFFLEDGNHEKDNDTSQILTSSHITGIKYLNNSISAETFANLPLTIKRYIARGVFPTVQVSSGVVQPFYGWGSTRVMSLSRDQHYAVGVDAWHSACLACLCIESKYQASNENDLFKPFVFGHEHPSTGENMI
ncbi:hypothetical protein LAZ67_6003910 [Cordylochernes scorpioides]|uniref:Uncharacterized protein n=1 Tax=Cordylochernes scorpioides TaxID=51811 RepID=A0ABY6KLD2_9ARAC|nr:hypothetical protein LAZ67_6003910 [Cordylochernes scorpioides]